jgi:hypothetical protein
VSPVKYELGFYIPEDDILHRHRRENLKSYRQNEVARERLLAKQSSFGYFLLDYERQITIWLYRRYQLQLITINSDRYCVPLATLPP